MTLLQLVAAGRGALPRNRGLRARIKPFLDADPELRAALRLHLELARDDEILSAWHRPGTHGPTARCPSDRAPH